MKNIAILTGGDSDEKVISYKTADVVKANLPSSKYNTFLIDVQGAKWKDLVSGKKINKNDFSLTIDGKKIKFDCAFAALHGSPMEDGKLQGYLEMMRIPYTCCDGFVSALTMNKHNTKTQLVPLGVPMAKSVLIQKGQKIDTKALLSMGLPLFVKPNSLGSSFGVSKVKTAEELIPAIKFAGKNDPEVVVESYLPGREFANGALRINGEIVVLPITEIISENEFFDFAAKYEGKSKEITPAEISPALTQQCQERSKFLYQALNCKGVVRFDYILKEETFYFLEVNTIPGMTTNSLVPQQARAAGWNLGDFFAEMVESAINQEKKK
jgi:D-alanine-D-alanine ligase